MAYLNNIDSLNYTSFQQDKIRSLLLEYLYNNVRKETSRSAEVLAELKKNYPLALVSNFYGNIKVVLEEMGLDVYFQDIIESATVGVRKPDPLIYNIGVKELRIYKNQLDFIEMWMDRSKEEYQGMLQSLKLN